LPSTARRRNVPHGHLRATVRKRSAIAGGLQRKRRWNSGRAISPRSAVSISALTAMLSGTSLTSPNLSHPAFGASAGRPIFASQRPALKAHQGHGASPTHPAHQGPAPRDLTFAKIALRRSRASANAFIPVPGWPLETALIPRERAVQTRCAHGRGRTSPP
jgi:hypothetical protein